MVLAEMYLVEGPFSKEGGGQSEEVVCEETVLEEMEKL